MPKLSDRLRVLRSEHKISQLKLSEELGLSQSAIASYETGDKEPTVFNLCCLADYYRVSTDYLLGRCDYRGTT